MTTCALIITQKSIIAVTASLSHDFEVEYSNAWRQTDYAKNIET